VNKEGSALVDPRPVETETEAEIEAGTDLIVDIQLVFWGPLAFTAATLGGGGWVQRADRAQVCVSNIFLAHAAPTVIGQPPHDPPAS